jgi:hypothetical protein
MAASVAAFSTLMVTAMVVMATAARVFPILFESGIPKSAGF